MKKFILSASLIATFMLYVVYAHEEPPIAYVSSPSGNLSSAGQPSSAQSITTDVPRALPSVVTSPSTSFPATGGMMSSMPPAHMGMYRDGEYTGRVVDVYYGNVEVKAIIQNGKIVDVQFLQHPSDRRASQLINAQAMPMLKSEAIQAQNANVDTISGATATSGGFVESLGDALLQAKV